MSDNAYLVAGIREMSANDVMGGTLTFRGAVYACNVGTFEQQDVLNADGGGFSPMLLGDVQLVAEDIAAGARMHKGDKVTVTPTTGNPRACYIQAVRYAASLVSLILRDENEGA